MGPKEIKAWETSDGSIFKTEEEANSYSKNQEKEAIKENEWSKLQKELKAKLGVGVYKEDMGWDCKTSPIGECVYEVDAVEKYGDECCYYCGQPEERK